MKNMIFTASALAICVTLGVMIANASNHTVPVIVEDTFAVILNEDGDIFVSGTIKSHGDQGEKIKAVATINYTASQLFVKTTSKGNKTINKFAEVVSEEETAVVPVRTNVGANNTFTFDQVLEFEPTETLASGPNANSGFVPAEDAAVLSIDSVSVDVYINGELHLTVNYPEDNDEDSEDEE